MTDRQVELGTLHADIEGYQGQRVPYEVPYLIIPSTSRRILIQVPGTGEYREGRRERYIVLGKHLAEKGIASMVSFNVPKPDMQFKYPDEPYSYQDASWNRISIEGLMMVTRRCLENAEAICGAREPELFMAGFSSGGSVVGAVAPHFPQVKKVLFGSTYDSMGEYFYAGVRAYQGEIFLAFGELDYPAVMLAILMPRLAPNARTVHSRSVPECDHGFRGPLNGRILSKAYLWAFAGDDTFPSPEGGIPLHGEELG
ncbi:MAG: hypothetical protein FJ315_03425 [SAR202 cluster bacterium]|nr:hypothetical protein [SAR202 cluster bacterium]